MRETGADYTQREKNGNNDNAVQEERAAALGKFVDWALREEQATVNGDKTIVISLLLANSIKTYYLRLFWRRTCKKECLDSGRWD